MKSDFYNAKALLNQKNRDLSQQFSDIQFLYQGRPSRPEDIELIKGLQEDIVQKEDELKKAGEDMKFYKLELINRENSFNNMFGGNHPSVGVVNPNKSATNFNKIPSSMQLQVISSARRKSLNL